MLRRSGTRAGHAASFALLFMLVSGASRADSVIENVFASMTLDGKKIGQIHFILKSAPTGEIQELRTNASVSVFGIKVYNFAQHLHETWRNDEIESLRSDADDNGTEEKISIDRAAGAFKAVRNGKPVDLPANAFPDSIWHYEIGEKTLLFNSVDLKLLKVSVKRSDETITLHGKKVHAHRLDFTGDWHATLWFGDNKRLLQAHRYVNDREIIITVDKDS
jgi:Domain of unknown function (DUF6134)